jgi:hypothetical protein
LDIKLVCISAPAFFFLTLDFIKKSAMKKLTLLAISLMFSLFTFASQLVMIPTGTPAQTKDAFNRKDLTVHFYNENFVIGSMEGQLPVGAIILDEKAWTDAGRYYFILRFDPEDKDVYIQTVARSAEILHEGNDFLIVSADEQQAALLYPAVHGGMIRITNTRANFPANSIHYQQGSLEARNDIFNLIAQVNADTLQGFVQHLQDYGTRNAYKDGGIQAQNWILAKFQSYGLSVELHDFSMPGGPASDNVLATLVGTKYPDEYVILGAHYDSYAGGNYEPGADDNATGTAGILEAARIMSQYQFDRTIIFATWSGEEYGLYGSGAWAAEAADNGMNILGYFNIDMAGYLAPGEVIHTDIIAPPSANELRQFYKDVCAIYLPDFPVYDGTLSGGDSDHTSFNNNGYQGIFPFEDSQNYSHFIHTPGDTIGTSVNNFEQHATFVKAIIANVVSMSDELPAPSNLSATPGDNEVILNWDAIDSVDYYNIYRNAEPIPYATAADTSYLDSAVENGTPYSYYVTAIFLNSGEESGPSNPVTAIPMPPITLPFFDDFETGAPYWIMEGSWGLQSSIFHSSTNALTESPVGDYAADLDISSTLRVLDFTGATTAQVAFWTRYQIEDGYDYMFLEVSTDGTNWDQIASFTGSQLSWGLQTYSLDSYINKTSVSIRFRFKSDSFVQAQGMFIDDLEVTVAGVGLDDKMISPFKTNLVFSPNPVQKAVKLNYWLENNGLTKILLSDSKGIIVNTMVDGWQETGIYSLELDFSGLPAGVYYGTLENNGQKISRKLIISR